MTDGSVSINHITAHFADGEPKDLFKVRRLANEQEVKGPAAAEVCHNDGVDRHRCKEFTPRSFKFLQREYINKYMGKPPSLFKTLHLNIKLNI